MVPYNVGCSTCHYETELKKGFIQQVDIYFAQTIKDTENKPFSFIPTQPINSIGVLYK